jgi:hypothetical protein
MFAAVAAWFRPAAEDKLKCKTHFPMQLWMHICDIFDSA